MASRRRTWNNLTDCLYGIMAPSLRGRVVYDRTPYASDGCWTARYRIIVDDAVIWDYPFQFENMRQGWTFPRGYPGNILNCRVFGGFDDTIERSMGRYIDTPHDELLDPIADDFFHLTDVLRSADRRIGLGRMTLWIMRDFEGDIATQKMLHARFGAGAVSER